MKLSYEEVRQILSIIEASSFDSIEIRIGDMTLAASKSGPLRAALPSQSVPPAQAPVTATSALSAPPAAPALVPSASEERVGEEGLVEIIAPIVGTFYLAPEPGAKPFVQEGDRINEETTVGIIEVMKVFTNIKAETEGVVVRCLVDDGTFVEFGQPILLVRPEA